MSYTPGPWETREGGAEVFGPAIYTPGAHDLDPFVAVDHLDPNADADARLIAAAPELLEALREEHGIEDGVHHEPPCSVCALDYRVLGDATEVGAGT